jgi:transcription antitermination factor NusG
MQERAIPGFDRRRNLFAALLLAGVLAQAGMAQDATPDAKAAPKDAAQTYIGTIKSLDGAGFTLTSDAGQDAHVNLADSVRILRIAPGEKDVKNATPMRKQELQVGDRAMVRARRSEDAHSYAAASVIVIKAADISAKKEKDREDWRRRGVGGLVTATDSATGTITISLASFTGTKSLTIKTSKNTILRRYAPNSVKFDDAKVAPFDVIKIGDQLRARGNKDTDGTELNAEEIVSGTFRNLAGQITSVDPSENTLTLKDAISKQSVTVRVTPDSQLRKLPPEFAQRIAARLKSAAAEGVPGASQALGTNGSSGDHAKDSSAPASGPGGGSGMGGRSGSADIQQILSRMPAVSLTDLQKGDTVMIVSTAGDGSQPVSAITMLAGVEAIVTAAPNASQAMMLSPWSLGSGNAEAAAAGP